LVKLRTWGIAVGSTALAAWAAFAQQAPRPDAAASDPAVATIGSLRITASEFRQRSEQLMADVRARSGTEPPAQFRAAIRRQLLETMIRHRLLMLEGERRGTVVSDEEAEAELRRDPSFQSGGQFDPARFAAFKGGNPTGYQAALRLAKMNVSAQRLGQGIERQNMPEEAVVRPRVIDRLSRARLSVFGLRRLDFDGSYEEPRESEIAAYYRAHADEFRAEARAILTVVFVNQPGLPDGAKERPDEYRAWEQRMRQRADSALAELRRGAPIDTLAARLGGMRRNVVVTRDQFPAYWHGPARLNEALFRQSAGSFVPEPVPGEPGWLVVRVEQVIPAGTASFTEAAPQIRARLRDYARSHVGDARLRRLYAQVRDSLRGPAYRIRYALADTGSFDPGEPSAAELERHYRAHLADYSSFDPARGTVVARSLAEAREDVRRRWQRQRRADLLAEACRRLSESWGRGKRDAALERAMSWVRDVGPVPAGGEVDSGLAGRALTDTLRERGLQAEARSIPFASGRIVYHVFGRLDDHVPSFEVARPLLRERDTAALGEGEVAGAREMFERDPERFRLGRVVHFSRLVVSPQDPVTVPLTRKEVVDHRDRHIDLYSAPEIVSARHILIIPKDASAAADAAARDLARSVTERARAGEDFTALAAQYSDDTPTKHDGGDLGSFERGVMQPELDRVLFKMSAGDVDGPVKTQVGYHVVKVFEHLPRVVQPLMLAYSNIGMDAARDKADAITQFRADSLYRAVKTPAQARAAARQLGLEVLHNEIALGEDQHAPQYLEAYLDRIRTLKPGEFYPGTQKYTGLGYVVSWVDSITAPRTPTWESARARVIEQYRLESDRRALVAKTVEIDSMLSAGWSADSLASLWGGWGVVESFAAKQSIPLLGGSPALDSLVFGRNGRGALAIGETSPWIDLPSGRARVRVEAREQPGAVQLQNAVDNERRIQLERNLLRVYDEFKRRHPVRIIDPELRATDLPPLPDL
jgi:parvulin-like peptidyl-prolyl isomerase